MRLRDIWPWLKEEFRWRVLGKRYEVIIFEEAQSQLDDLPEEAQAEIRKAIERICRNPYRGDREELDQILVGAIRAGPRELFGMIREVSEIVSVIRTPPEEEEAEAI